ncbi:MAG: starch-binding protein, partial [Paludibacteraceae bacterium]|nr:starch-binding protein [Paludibacteraceae bacterium]
MKKLSFFLMAMLVSLTSFAAALGEGYEKVTDVSALAAGDKVVLYCDDAELGITGWDGNKTATAAAEGWVEYVVEAADGGVLLKDGEQYIALTAKNTFSYTATGSVCKVNAEGVLYITLSGTDYLLYENANNGNPLYRMYVDKTGNAQYKPVYVYEVVAEEEVPVVTKEEKTTCVPGTLADGKVTHDLPCCVIVQEQGESTTALKSVAPWEAPANSLMTITPKEGVTILTYVINTKNTTLGTYLGKSELTNATKTATSNGLVTFTVTNGTEPVVMKFVSATQKFHEITFTYTVAGGTTDPEPVMYTVTVAAENGTVEGAGEYAENAEATLTATPAEGYEFVNWTVDGAEVSTENPYTFVVTANVALVANFKEVVTEEPLPEGVPTQEELWASFQTAAGLSLGTLSEIAASTNPVPCKVICTPLTATEVQKAFANAEWAWLKNYIKEVQNAQKGNPVASSTVPELTDDLTPATWRYAIAAFFLQTQYAAWPYSADFTEAGKPENWGPAYLAAQEGTTPEPEPVMETVYFVNALNWTGTINAYAWDPVQNANWPGVAATKEAEQIAGYDVYSYTAEAGTYKNIIFNGTGGQTADLVWTAGKYYVKDGWYTKEEAEAQLAKPVEYESVYFVNAQGWSKVNIYTWTPEVGGWPGVAMTKEAEQLAGYDVYSYTVEKGTSFGGMLFNNTTGSKTGDLKWTAGKYYVKDAWYTKEEAEAKLAGPVTPPVITYVLMGVKGDWATGIALTQNADNANEYVLLGQEIAEGDAVKVVTLTDGVATAWCGNVDEYSVERSYDDMGNIVLAPGKYDFYYKVAEDLIYIAAVVPAVEPCTEAIAVNWNEPIALQANADVWYHLNLATAVEGGNDISVLLVNTSDEETEITVAAYENCPELDIITEVTKTLKPNEKLDGIAEYAEYLDGQVSEMYIHVTTKGGAVEVSAETVKPEIEWIPMDLEITNLTTEVLEVEGAKYLQLMGRNDMNDADVMLFLNNYADVDDDYVVNAENSLMTFGGIELTVLEGVIAQVSETDKGTIYQGTVRTYAAEEDMYVEFALLMYAAPATELVVTDATVEVNENLGTLTFKTADYFVELSGYTAPGVHEGPQICLLETPEAVAFANYVETVVADGIITLTGEFTSFMGAKFALTISGKLPVVEPVEKPEPTYTENQLNTYAFGLESELTEEALNVTYRLNNSNATSVNVLVYKGEEVVATVAGTTTIGVNTVAIPVAELPQGRMLTWSVEVNGTSVEVPTLEEKIYSFYHPSGVDVDNNPENPTFGLLLTNEAMQSVASKTDGYVSAQFGAGIFAFTPSFDLIPNGDQPGYNGGKTFSTVKNDFAPRRIRISEDGRIFATAQDGSGEYLWEINPENLNDWTTVFQGTNDGYTLKDADGNFIAGTNSGFDVRGEGENLQLLMLSASLPGAQVGSFKCHTYDLGAATTWATAPTKEIPGANYMLVTNQSNAQFDKDGGVWYIQYRGTTTESEPGLVHINKDGVEDLKQLRHYTRNAGFRFTDDFSKVIIAGVTDGSNVKKATIYAVSQDENGAPVLTEETVIETSVLGSNLNDFAWDYAGNLYGVSNSNEKLAAWAMPYSGQVVTPAASKYAFHIGELLPDPAVVTEMVGVVKRAVQNGESTIVLTHETDGTAHIYEVTNGTILELLQNGVVPVDPENKGSYLAISDIAVTEDGKLVANNYVRNQFAGTTPEAGYLVGTSYYYIWNDLHGAPSVWFTSQTTARSSHGDVGVTFALKGTSTNAELLVTAVHNNNRAVRLAKYNIIDGQYVEPNIPGGQQSSEYYEYFGTHTKEAYYQEAVQGKQFQLNVSPLGDNNWIMDGELVDPSEFVLPGVGENYAASATLTEDLGKKYNGATYVTVGEQVLMVAPFATPEGKLTSVEILDITAGLDAPQYVDQLFIDEAVEATAAATAVKVVEGEEANVLLITLVADATIYSLEATLAKGDNWEVYEDEISNLVIDLDNLVLIGGPSSAFQVDVYLPLGEYNMSEDSYQLTAESSIAV